MDGTARAIGPIADQVLVWVRSARERGGYIKVRPDELRRIELMAQAAREAAMFHQLYGMEGHEHPDAPSER